MSDVPRIDPVAVRSAQFQGSFRKYDSRAVDQYLADLADQLVKVNNYIEDLERQISAAPRASAHQEAEADGASTIADAAGDGLGPSIFERPSLSGLGDDELVQLVGEETAHVLATARKAANDIRAKAEESSARLIRESTAEAKQVRDEAEAVAERNRAEAKEIQDKATREAETEAATILDRANADADRRVAEARALADDELVRAERVRAEADEDAQRVRDDAKEEGRAMLAEAKEVRSRILEDLQKRRDQGRAQIERLVVGRDRLLEAYASVRANVDEMTHELETVLDNPFERDPGMDEGFVGIVTTATDDEPGDGQEREPDLVTEEDHPPPVDDAGPAPTAAAEDETLSVPGDDDAETADAADADDQAPEPAAAAEVTSAGESDVADAEAEGDGDGGHDADRDGDTIEAEGDTAESGGDVDELFARIRAEREESVARAQAVLADGSGTEAAGSASTATGSDVDAAAAVDVDDDQGDDSGDQAVGDADQVPADHLADGEVYEHRRELLAAQAKDLSRSLKRVLADEQNQVLDALRRSESTAVDDLLPAEDGHVAAYVKVAEPILADVARAAAGAAADADAPDVSGVAHSLASAVVGPFRRRIANSASEVGDDHEELDERLRSLYREWKIEHIGAAAGDALYSAYAVGQFAAAPDGARLRWLIDPDQGPCPDAQDNALEGPVAKGDAFPTGDLCPQAHAGCHCLLLVEP